MTDLVPFHGGQLRQIADRFGIPAAELLDFSANINPDGPPAGVFAALRRALTESPVLMEYPDLEEWELRQSLARYAGVRPECVAVANGFVPLFEAALRILEVRRCVVPVPAFVEYRRALERCRIEMATHALASEADFRCDVNALFSDPCDAMLLTNPQNPSGVVASRETMLRIAKEAAERNVWLFLDEAFIDYCPELSLVGEVDRLPNLIVFRSVTKFFSMAGLRVAYAIANPELCRQMQETIAPWPVTTVASLAASAAVQDEEYAQRAIALNHRRRNELQPAIHKFGIYAYPSAANFLLLRLPGSMDGQQFWEYLIREHRVVLRNCVNYEALDGRYLRVAVRTEAENERLSHALACGMERECRRALTPVMTNHRFKSVFEMK